MPRFLPLAVLGLCSLLPAFVVRAAESPDSTETRLRDALRSANLQLAAAQNDRDALQAAAAESDRTAKAAEVRAQSLLKQSLSDRADAGRTIAGLQAKLAAQTGELARLSEARDKARTDGEQAARAARAEGAERQRLEGLVLVLRRQTNDDELKNLALYKIAKEILGRYENFSLGNALAAKEPFVGATRTKLENLVQGYDDKLQDQRIVP